MWEIVGMTIVSMLCPCRSLSQLRHRTLDLGEWKTVSTEGMGGVVAGYGRLSRRRDRRATTEADAGGWV
jgi:hypothetical protein